MTRWTSKPEPGPRSLALISPSHELDEHFINEIAGLYERRLDDPEGLCTWFADGPEWICFVRARGNDPISWGCSAAVLTFDSASGVDGASIERWQSALASGLPGIACVSGLDNIASDFDESAAIIRRISSDYAAVEPIVAPLLSDDESVAGYLDLLGMRIWMHVDGDEVERTCDPEHLSVTSDARERLVESILLATTDDDAVERAIDEGLDPVSIAGLFIGCARDGSVIPVLGAGELTGRSLIRAAISELLPGSGSLLPDVTTCDGYPSEPLSASGSTFATRVSSHSLRVWSGSFANEADIKVGCKSTGQLRVAAGFHASAGHVVLCVSPLPSEANSGVSDPNSGLQRLDLTADE